MIKSNPFDEQSDELKKGDYVRYRIRTDIYSSSKVGVINFLLDDGVTASVYWMVGAKNVNRLGKIDVENVPLCMLERVDEDNLESSLDDMEPSKHS